ncbi:hypothetical protein BDW75DRAFT_188820 [Aspergillus navahoensis]
MHSRANPSSFATALLSSQVVLRPARLVPSLTVAIILSRTRISPNNMGSNLLQSVMFFFSHSMMRKSNIDAGLCHAPRPCPIYLKPLLLTLNLDSNGPTYALQYAGLF